MIDGRKTVTYEQSRIGGGSVTFEIDAGKVVAEAKSKVKNVCDPIPNG
jgi:hypothetical protein